MAPRSDSRVRMIETAAELFRQRGYHATSFADVIRESGAPRGSIYFHFPGGKEELARAAVAGAGAESEEIVDEVLRGTDDAASFVKAVCDVVAGRLEASGYRAGCAIATMVLELAPDADDLRPHFEAGFERWHVALVRGFRACGQGPKAADDYAYLLMSTLEGALVLSRATRSLEAFHRSRDALAGLISRRPKRS